MDDQASEVLLVGLPTHDGRAVISSLVELTGLGRLLGGPIRILTGEGGNIPRARNYVMEQARRESTSKYEWILWMDSDIVLSPGGNVHIAAAIEWSKRTGKGWVAHYRMADGRSCLMRERQLMDPHHYTLQELGALPEWSEIGMAGMGLAFLRMDLSYVFRADVVGEDINFFLDHPDMTIHYAKRINLGHRKTVVL